MWKHQAGRMDFDGPLFQLLQRGWRFQEFGPIVGAREGGCWAVTGFHGWARVRVDRAERRDAWAEAVRLGLRAASKRGPSGSSYPRHHAWLAGRCDGLRP